MKNSVQPVRLESLTDKSLLQKTKELVKQERNLLAEILHHLREVERRRLFSSLRYSSLFDYCVRELQYSESQAQRRISAMRLMRDLPQIEDKITSGELSLTNLALAQNLFNKAQDLSSRQKVELLQKFEKKSTREAEAVVKSLYPEFKRPEIQLRDIQDESLREKLLQIKGRLAHQHPQMDLNELLHKLCDHALDSANIGSNFGSPVCRLAASPSAPKVKSHLTGQSKAAIRRRVWLRDGRKCVRCGSFHALEIDHIRPRALGGTDHENNLRVLCRHCNQRAAIELLGLEKMTNHLQSRGESRNS